MTGNANKKRDIHQTSAGQQVDEAVPMKKHVPSSETEMNFPNFKRPRVLKLRTSRQEKKKKFQEMEKKCIQHDSIVRENSIKELFQVKSPHVILSN